MTPPDAGREELAQADEIIASCMTTAGDAAAMVVAGPKFILALQDAIARALTTHAETIRQLKTELKELGDSEYAREGKLRETIRRLEARLKVRCVKHGESEAPLVCEECVNEDMSSMDETIRRLEGEVAEYEAIAELMRRRESPWIKRWQEATGKHDTLPDYGEMLTWIVQRAEAAESLAKALSQYAVATKFNKSLYVIGAAGEAGLVKRFTPSGRPTYWELTELGHQIYDILGIKDAKNE